MGADPAQGSNGAVEFRKHSRAFRDSNGSDGFECRGVHTYHKQSPSVFNTKRNRLKLTTFFLLLHAWGSWLRRMRKIYNRRERILAIYGGQGT